METKEKKMKNKKKKVEEIEERVGGEELLRLRN